MRSEPAAHPDCPSCPIESVSWWDALAWCNARSRADRLVPCYWLVACRGSPGVDFECERARPLGAGRDLHRCQGYRLPTEAEWEYAARAGTRTAVHSGEITAGAAIDPSGDSIAWYADNAEGAPRPVAEKASNPWGLYDVSGNVEEWVWDWIGDYEGDATDPVGPCGDEGCVGLGRALRGGGFDSGKLQQRHAERAGLPPASRSGSLGFRVARTAAAPEYALGDLGPAGGIVFFDKGEYSDGWRYMEVAPSDQGSAPWGCSGSSFGARDGEAGGGLENTRKIVEGCAERTAGQIASEYDYGDHYDWFLPGTTALVALYHGLHLSGLGNLRGAPGGPPVYYWTSVETVPNFGWYVNFADGSDGAFVKSASLRIRPVRRF